MLSGGDFCKFKEFFHTVLGSFGVEGTQCQSTVTAKFYPRINKLNLKKIQHSHKQSTINL